MKEILKKRVTLIGGGLTLFIGFILFLSFDAFYGGYHFRTMQDEIAVPHNVDLTGLRGIQASGGYAPRFAYLQMKLNHIKAKKNIVIVDAMCEFHGYIKSIPTTFLGYQRRIPDVH